MFTIVYIHIDIHQGFLHLSNGQHQAQTEGSIPSNGTLPGMLPPLLVAMTIDTAISHLVPGRKYTVSRSDDCRLAGVTLIPGICAVTPLCPSPSPLLP